MKVNTGILFLLLGLVGDSYTQQVTSSAKTIPSTKTLPITVTHKPEECHTTKSFSLEPTTIPNPTGTPLTAYNVVPKTYEICTRDSTTCSSQGVSYLHYLAELTRYTPIECNINTADFYGEIDDVADPNQPDIFIPPVSLVTKPASYAGKNEITTELLVKDRTLYCYDKNVKMTTSFTAITNGCVRTTLEPVDITPVTTTTTTKSIPTFTTTTTKMIPVTTTTTKAIPVTTTTTKMIPVTTTTTKTIPVTTSKCLPITITVTDKETVTLKETVTVTVQSDSTPVSENDSQCADKWAQCGGQGFNGPTCCKSGSTCHEINQYYSQCL